VYSTWADLDLVEQDLGYRPRVGFAGGIKAQSEWVLGEGLASSSVGGGPDPFGNTR